MRALYYYWILFAVLGLPALALAQGTFESFGEYLPVVDAEQVLDGDIITIKEENYKRADTNYDDRLYGVVNQQPAIGLNVRGSDATTPVVSTGTVSVNVSVINGVILPGDFITTSERPGVGMRANDPGVVLGTSLESFDPQDSNEVGQVVVAINKHFAVSPRGDDLGITRTIGAQIRNALVTGAVAAVSDPNTALRYFVATMVMLLSLAAGLYVFGRSATKGVEAVGRNPLAKKSIILAISFNVLMTVAITISGVVVAFFILAF